VQRFDDLVLGAGMGGLAAAALLARSGRRVGVLEAHDVPGGYAHSFGVRGYRFCAQVHYIFGCGEGEGVHALLTELGIAEQVPFLRLDPEGFDHVVVAGERFRVPNGLEKHRDRLVRRFPESRRALFDYFDCVRRIADELAELEALPERPSFGFVVRNAWRYRHLVRHLRSTLGMLFDAVDMPPLLRAVLAGQSGDYLLPPRDVSLLLHVALVAGYDRGAYYPKHHYHHLVESLAGVIAECPGSAVLLEREVTRIEVEAGRVASVSTRMGETFAAERVISNIDPRRTAELVGRAHFDRADRARLGYDYSAATFTMYLGISGLDLREHGFGSFNVWRYPHADLDRIYDRQLRDHDSSDPWLFLSTPTLHSSEPGIAPPGHHILEVATALDYRPWKELRERDRRAYYRGKNELRDRVLDILEAEFVPDLRKHLTLRLTGTGATNERFCGAPEGNSYGAALTPAHVGLRRRPFRTSIPNLWMVGATAGFPSVAGALGAGRTLAHSLLE